VGKADQPGEPQGERPHFARVHVLFSSWHSGCVVHIFQLALIEQAPGLTELLQPDQTEPELARNFVKITLGPLLEPFLL